MQRKKSKSSHYSQAQLKVARHQKSRPALLCKLSVFDIVFDKVVWLIKKKWKIALACLFFVVDVLMLFSTHLCNTKTKQKRIFIKNSEIWGGFFFLLLLLFLILFLLQQLRTTEAKSLQNGCLKFLLSLQKIKPVTTHKMQNVFPSDWYEHNLSRKHVFDWS